MNQILLSGIDENYYSKKHLNFKSIESERTYIIDKNKIDYIETISFSVLNQEEKEEIHYQYLTFVGDNVFSFVSNIPEYYEPLLLGNVSGDAKFKKIVSRLIPVYEKFKNRYIVKMNY